MLNLIYLTSILQCYHNFDYFCTQIIKEEMNIIKYITLLIISPNEGWKDINKYNIPNGLLLNKLFYPSLAFLAISSFVPFIFGYVVAQLNEVVINAMLDFIKYFVTFFAVSYLLTGFFRHTSKTKDVLNKTNNFIVFNLTILVFFNILRILLPGFPFFEIFPIYIVYVIYRGVSYLELPKEQEYKFITVMSLLILLLPAGIKFVLNLLIPSFSA